MIVSDNIRYEFIAATLARGLAAGEQNPPSPELVSKYWNRVTEHHDLRETRFKPINSGQKKAMYQAVFPWLREVGIFTQFAEMFKEPSFLYGAMQKIEIERFCKLADALSVHSPDLELLRSLSGWPSDPMELVRDAEHKFFVPWTRGQHNEMPFGLLTKYGNLTFVFRSRGALWDDFVTASASKVPSGWELKSRVITAGSNCDAITLIFQGIPDPLRPSSSVIIEGTRTFDMRIRELIGGTIWPTTELWLPFRQ